MASSSLQQGLVQIYQVSVTGQALWGSSAILTGKFQVNMEVLAVTPAEDNPSEGSPGGSTLLAMSGLMLALPLHRHLRLLAG